MKTISEKQPWGFLICSGIKDIENRTWNTNFRGRVLVHTSAKPSVKFKNRALFEFYKIGMTDDMILSANNIPNWADCLKVNGAIIGSVEIVDCVINSESIWAEKTDKFADMFINPIYNWVLANPILFAEPILNVKGKLRFWDYPMTEEEYLNRLKIGQTIPESVKRRVEENNRYWQNGGHNGPTGHGHDICYSDADPGL